MDEPKSASQSPVSTPSLRAKLYRWRSLLKRCWWIAVLAVSISLCVQGYLISQEAPTYISRSKMWVSGKVSVMEGAQYREELQNFFGTQIELMKSELIRNRAHARAKLLNPKIEQVPVNLTVMQAPRAAVFIMQTIGGEPRYTQAFLQSLMDEYLAYKQEIRRNSSVETLSQLQKQTYGPEKELEEAQEAMLNFQRSHNIVFLTEQGSSAGSYLAKLNTRVAEMKTEAQLLELLSSDQVLEPGKSPALDGKAAESNPQVAGYQKAREQLNLLKMQRKDLGQFLKDKHPKMVKMDEEIGYQERYLESLRQQSKEQMAATRTQLSVQIKNLEQSIGEWELKAQESSRKMADYEKLKGNVARLQGLYERLRASTQSVNIGQGLDQENVSILENALGASMMPAVTSRKLTVAFIVGLLIGFGILYFIDRHDDRISSINELMQNFEVPAMGHVPSLDIRKGKKLELVHAQDQRHSFVEAFRDIRSALLFTGDKGARPKTILVTSAIPNEGKSSVSSNLAVTLAISGARVLLVDADLRCGTLHDIFGIGPGPGLYEILSGELSVNDAIRSTNTPNLSLIAAGKPSQTAGELFLSDAAEQFIKDIYPNYDFIVIDSAPVLATADTASFAPKLDGVLFVVRGAFTSARLCRNALELLRQRQVNILGLVLNRADSAYPEYYQYKYTKYYHRAAASA